MSVFTIKRFVGFLFIILCIIALDQSLKEWVVTHLRYNDEMPIIDGILHLRHTQNPGVVLGIPIHGFKYIRLVFLGFKILLLILFFLYIFAPERHEKFIKTKIVAGAFLIGGGLSNCLDWMFNGFLYNGVLCHDAPFKFGYGTVVDMFVLPFTYFQTPFSWPILGGIRGCFPIFNIADIFIFLSFLVLIRLIFKLEATHTSNRIRNNNAWLKKKKKRKSLTSRTKIKVERSTAKNKKSK